MWTKLSSFVPSLYARTQVQREEGQALVEYVLILSLIVVLSIALLTTLGQRTLKSLPQDVTQYVDQLKRERGI